MSERSQWGVGHLAGVLASHLNGTGESIHETGEEENAAPEATSSTKGKDKADVAQAEGSASP